MQKTIVMIDIDGVLIDNRIFETKVTEYIVCELARMRGVSLHEATGIWDAELRATKNSPEWYDYDFHCVNLQLKSLARDAHSYALPWLKSVDGAIEVWNYLADLEVSRSIVTDSCPWVARLKLAKMGFDGYDSLVSSREIGLTKSMPAFWRVVLSKLPHYRELALIDNSASNIQAAIESIPKLRAAYFAVDEHIDTLHEKAQPLGKQKVCVNQKTVEVQTHEEFVGFIGSVLGGGSL